MATYAIGDVQGCYDELCDLLELVDWQPARDTLWLVGDLVNRGPRSLDVLRFAKKQSGKVVCVLGNHDLHLLATYEGERKPKCSDTFVDVLNSREGAELLGWLRARPLIHYDPVLDFVMVHAGLAPQWDLNEALTHGKALSRMLCSDDYRKFLANMYGDRPASWTEDLSGWDRMRFFTNVFTRLRFCDTRGQLVMGPAGPPELESPDLVPWYAVSGRKSRARRIVFGHWATLQQCAALDPAHNVFHIDSGCVWGGGLTALRLNDLERFTVPSRNA